ncbi:type VI secretion system contractile sheath small subunit [Desulfobaculum senezii]
MAESIQHKLDRVRPPRVQITYDVEIGGAIVMKQLPYVVGIMADLTAKPVDPLPPLKERKFVYIDRDNINDVLKKSAPHIAYNVPNTLGGDDETLGVDLSFASMDDFEPAQVVKRIPKLNELLEARQKLVDLLGKLDGNDDLAALLHDTIGDEAKLKELLDLASADDGGGEEDAKKDDKGKDDKKEKPAKK